MGYRGLKPGEDAERSVQGRARVESLSRAERGGALRQQEARQEEEQHLRTLRGVRDLLARGPPAVVAAAYEDRDSDTEHEWREREGMMRQRETLQKFSHWICDDKASKTSGAGRANCRQFGSFAGSSSSSSSSLRASNGTEMCQKIYDRERERCKVTNGALVSPSSRPRERHGPTLVHGNQRPF